MILESSINVEACPEDASITIANILNRNIDGKALTNIDLGNVFPHVGWNQIWLRLEPDLAAPRQDLKYVLTNPQMKAPAAMDTT
jgi:hypothetical protein